MVKPMPRPHRVQPKEDDMRQGGGAFSPEEVEYLRSLPVVAEATARRITYTESFKHHCMRRYRAGASPVELFREAGLDPALIGYKRIERCFARWRKIACRTPDDPAVPQGSKARMPVGAADSDGVAHVAGTACACAATPAGPSASSAMPPSSAMPSTPPGTDLRDLIIAQQARRIDELERQMRALRAPARA